MSSVTCQVSGVKCQVSGLTCHVSGVKCHNLLLYFFLKSGGANWEGSVINRAYLVYFFLAGVKCLTEHSLFDKSGEANLGGPVINVGQPLLVFVAGVKCLTEHSLFCGLTWNKSLFPCLSNASFAS